MLIVLATIWSGLSATARAPVGRGDRSSGAAVVTYVAPVALHVVHGFDPPANGYGPGQLGVDLAAAQGHVVAAAGAGVVVFAGPVAGRSLVVVRHPDGIRTEYEPLHPVVRSGQRVRAGQEIGVVDGHHDGCATSCLHWGARRGELYLDPLSLLSALGPVRLLPWSHEPAEP